MHLRDEVGTIYTDEQFAALYPAGGQFAEPPWRIALVLVMQFMENYTDRQAARAMRTHTLLEIRVESGVDRSRF
jgi:transposase